MAGGTQARDFRQSNFELLRIIAMLMIVAHHFSVHDDFTFSPDMITINRLWVQPISMGGKIGVDLFVLISGFFLINSPYVKTLKALKLIFQTTFYSVAFFLLFTLVRTASFDITLPVFRVHEHRYRMQSDHQYDFLDHFRDILDPRRSRCPPLFMADII